MCVEVLDEHRYTRCGHVYTARMSIRFCFNAPFGSNDPCPNSTEEVRNKTDITDRRCFSCNPGQPVLAAPSSIMQALHAPGFSSVADRVPLFAPSVPVFALAAALLQQPAVNTSANPAATTDKSEQSDETEVNFDDFVNDSYETGVTAVPDVPDATSDEALQSVLADVDGFDFGLTNTDNQPAVNGKVSDNSVAADNGQQPYDSELDAEGETDPDYAAPVSRAQAPITTNGDDGDDSELSMPDASSDNGSTEKPSSDDSTSEGSPDEGSLYEDSDESEAQRHAMMIVANRPMNRPATIPTARAPARGKGKGKGKLMATATKIPPTKVTKRKTNIVTVRRSARVNAADATTSKDTAADADADAEDDDDDADDEASITSNNDNDA
ncbi:hypothetical protein F503_03938 [Ophiostoma piceae UAMH 11346]|uniref:Uncharacterized protein n=1 Tax=Ophiostoma piceae (strain UAMH 11346) TaxID=1262450 RepID=S3C835_OPHP1|nr:hypothetical protein F503_03938 [Ophiostoma piceae UAMH 11346]